MEPELGDLLAGCAVLDGEGLTTAFGHLSVRCGDGGVLISGNCGPGLVRGAQDVLALDAADGTVRSGDQRLRPGEAAIHLGILAARDDVQSVCRFHGPSCLAFSTLCRPLPAAIGYGLFCGAAVPCFQTARTVTTPERGAALATCLGDGNAVLLRGFGAATVGRTVAEAVVRARMLERSAAATLAASAVGEPVAYPADAAAPFAAAEGPAAGQIARAWRYLCARWATHIPPPSVQEGARA
jgi:ribulose-5-phosphate 4-epimerase/fuculose-1-phosphate aldolase